jgi:YYY domain-containing protein
VIAEPATALFETPSIWERLSLVLLSGLVVGALQVTNSWDYPTYLLLLSAAFLVAGYVRRRAITMNVLIEAGLSAAGSFIVGLILFLPFTRSYELFYSGVDLVTSKTSIQHYLVIFGFFLFCVGSSLLAGLWKNRWHRFWIAGLWDGLTGSPRATRRRELSMLLAHPTPWMELLPYVAMGLLGMAAVAAALRLFLIALLFLLILLALLSLFEKEVAPERLLLSIFVGLAAVLTLCVEFVAIKGDIGRMNTVFKFYLQAWFLMGAVSALGVAGILWRWKSAGTGWLSGWRRGWALLAGLLFLSVMIYPVAATPVKVGLRFQSMPPELDGMDYMRQASFTDQNKPIVMEHDYSALRWVQDHIAGSPVVLEAQIPEYRWGSRVSIYTGLPTVLGWTWHQRQQRSGYQWMIEDRLRDIKAMYESTDTTQVASLLRKYDVSLVYVGDLERAYYPSAGLAKFDRMTDLLSVVYSTDGVTIYEVKRPDRGSVVLPSQSERSGG